MGSAETKKLEKKDGKYKYECPNYCKNIKYRNDTKYSTRNLVCKKCGKRLIRWQPAISKERGIFNTVLNDSDTPSIPLYDTDNPDKPVEIGKLDDSSESASETESPPSDFDKTAREEANDTKGQYDPSAPKEEDVDSPQLQLNSKQLYPKASEVEKEVKFQEYMDDQDEQKAKGAIRKNNPPRTTENHAQLPSMKDDRLDRFLFDIDNGHESDNDDTQFQLSETERESENKIHNSDHQFQI